jgi:predicted peptidase
MRYLLFAAVLCLLAPCIQAQSDTPPEDPMQKPLKFQRKVTRTLSANYLLYLPRQDDTRSDKRWPLILFLHGAGERGTNIWKVAVHGPPKILRNRSDFPFIVVSPQCPPGERWSNEVLVNLLDEIISQHAVDTNRIYLTGLSMGGFGTWSLAAEYPHKWAAIAPICGGGDVIPVLLAGKEKRAALQTLGVWAFHGAKDNTVKLAESEKMVEAFKKIGCEDIKLTVYPEAGHDSWTETYNNPELYEWFLKHERKPTLKSARR